MRQAHFSVGLVLVWLEYPKHYIRAPLPSADAATPGSEQPGPEGIPTSFWWPKGAALHKKPSRN